MDKKTGIIIGVISAVVLVMVGYVFMMDSKVEELPKDVIATINGTEFKVDDFKTYMNLRLIESGETATKPAEEVISSMMDPYIIEKMYYTKALSKGLTVDETKDYSGEYAEKADEYRKMGISLEDYSNLKKQSDLADEFKTQFSNYYEVPSDTYQAVVDEYKDQDMYYTYHFRVMQIPYTNPEEESGDAVDSEEVPTSEGEVANTTEEVTEEEKKDTSKEAQKIVAEDVLSRLRAGEKSGETFQDLSREYGTYRFTFVGNGYTLINGDEEYATGPVLKSKLGGEDDIYEAFLKLEPGEYTDVFDEETYTSFEIVKLESKEEGFVGDAEKELKDLILNELMQNMIIEDSSYKVNQLGYLTLLY